MFSDKMASSDIPRSSSLTTPITSPRRFPEMTAQRREVLLHQRQADLGLLDQRPPPRCSSSSTAMVTPARRDALASSNHRAPPITTTWFNLCARLRCETFCSSTSSA